MAGIDKIYGTNAQFREFEKWLKQHKPEALNYLYYDHDAPDEKTNRVISNFPIKIDGWLLTHCPIIWVQARLMEQYGLITEEIQKELVKLKFNLTDNK